MHEETQQEMRRVGLCGVERKSGTLPAVQKQSDYWLWICRTLTLNLKDNLSFLQFIFTVAAKGARQYAQSFMNKSDYKQTNSLTAYSKRLYSKVKLKSQHKKKKITCHKYVRLEMNQKASLEFLQMDVLHLTFYISKKRGKLGDLF